MESMRYACKHFKLKLANIICICSDPPLEEDDIPPGEWICHRCRTAPKEVIDVCCFGQHN